MENQFTSQKNHCSEIVIPDDCTFNNVSKILNISELEDKYYNNNILSPSNSISLYNEIIKKESNYAMNNLNNNCYEDKQSKKNKKVFFQVEINGILI